MNKKEIKPRGTLIIKGETYVATEIIPNDGFLPYTAVLFEKVKKGRK